MFSGRVNARAVCAATRRESQSDSDPYTRGMLPAWATVLVALGASAVGGVGGSIITAYLQIRHEREDQLRGRMVDAADDFATGMRQARTALLHARDAIHAGNHRLRLQYLDESARLIDEASARLARVHLLFGTGSGAGESGTVAISLMSNLLDGLKEEPEDTMHRSRDWGRLRDALSFFNQAALKSIRNPSAATQAAEGAESLDEALAQLGIP